MSKRIFPKKAKERFDFMYSDAHGLAYMLDPRYLGDGMERLARDELEGILYNHHGDEEDIVKILCNEYAEFVFAATQDRMSKTATYNMLMEGRKSVLQYWTIDGKDWPQLQKIAMKLFSMATSSAASERNWSTMASSIQSSETRSPPPL